MDIHVRPLAAADLPAASRINRAAFSRFFGIPDPAKFRIGADVIGQRWRLWPEAGIAAELDGRLAAAGLMIRWGSVAILGPVVVAPEHWSKGLARALMPKLLEPVGRGDFAFTGLVTHPQSPKHVRLYESFGFRMQRITAVMAKFVSATPAAARQFSRLPGAERAEIVAAMRELTDGIFPGLDVTAEAADLATHGLGETLLLESGGRLDALALCHVGPGSEASEGQVFVKFAAARGGKNAQRRFQRLLSACEAYAGLRGATLLVAGTNTGRTEAYELMLRAGFRTTMNVVAMTRPGTDGYNRPEIFAIDDWR